MTLSSVYATLTTYDGYCAGCSDDLDAARPLMVVERGPRGLRAWLSGVGADDRALSYTCLVCGRNEVVPLTEAEDEEYAATLASWPDWSPVVEPAPVPVVATVAANPGDVFVLAAAALQKRPAVITLPARTHTVRVVDLPSQRVQATDGKLLAFSA